MKIISIIGAQPQSVEAAAVSRKIRQRHQEILVHTGQYSDYDMPSVFFDGPDIPAPDGNVQTVPRHGRHIASMLEGIEDLLLAERPDWLLAYGDTNATLAGVLAASKASVPIAHMEAGLRSFNRRMPEEINRVVADHLSALLLCPSQTAVANLQAEGISQNVHLVGDVMLDVLRWAQQRLAARPSPIVDQLGLEDRSYLLATVHRAENTDDPERFASILRALNETHEPVVFPVQPRARRFMATRGVELRPHIRVLDPVGYLDMVALVEAARLVLTDSGGLQKEAYWLGVPCLTLRDETEWVETVDTGWNTLVGSDAGRILRAVRSVIPPESHPILYGDGCAADKCVDLLERTG